MGEKAGAPIAALAMTRTLRSIARRMGLGHLRRMFRREPAIAAPSIIPEGPPPLSTEERDLLLSGWRNAATGELFEGVPVGAGDVVADIGCSDRPRVARFCAERGARVILVDTDTVGLAGLRPQLSDLDPALLTFVEGEAAGIPLADGTASIVVSTEVLEHVDDPVAFMAELVRIGRPGARYILSVPDPVGERLVKQIAHPSAFEKPNHIRIFEREQFTELVRDAGLIVELQRPYGFYFALGWIFFWADWVDPVTMTAPRMETWAHTWGQVLDGKDGFRIKKILDEFMPRSQIIVARKA
jgi:SAM-dependent methyltransferase